jgi:rare lipoprotein A
MKFAKLLLFLLPVAYMGLSADAYLEKCAPAVYPGNGLASWYTARITATGEAYDPDSLTCAMRRKPYGKFYNVCSRRSGKCVAVRHNNWGPRRDIFDRGRVIDLSKAAFRQLADLNEGVLEVSVEEINR